MNDLVVNTLITGSILTITNTVIISVKIKFHNNIVVDMEFYTMISLQGDFVVLITNDIYNDIYNN